jgi:hypothetical protein
MKIAFSFATHHFTASLFANPAAQELVMMLPLDLSIEDYGSNEKIAYLPAKLKAKAERFDTPRIGDLCYYTPWGNLVFYYDSYRYDPGLLRLGRLDDGIQPLMTRGTHPLRAEKLP